MLSFQCVGPRDWTQAIRFGRKCLYLLSHLGNPKIQFYYLQAIQYQNVLNGVIFETPF